MANTRSLANATALRDEDVLRRVRHLGSARKGLWEWRLQRQTALALIPLGLYFVASMLLLAIADQLTAARWLSSPVPALMTILRNGDVRACGRRAALGARRLRAYARPAGGRRAAGARRRDTAGRSQRARCPKLFLGR